jgi:hypothetical protein
MFVIKGCVRSCSSRHSSKYWNGRGDSSIDRACFVLATNPLILISSARDIDPLDCINLVI